MTSTIDPRLTVRAVRDWAAKQNPETEYRYLSIHDCFFGRYFKAVDFPYMLIDPCGWRDEKGDMHLFPDQRFADLAAEHPWTFGGVLARCEVLLAADAASASDKE